MFDANSKNKRLMRRVYEEMWNQANPAAAVELFARPEGVERFVSQFLESFPGLQHTVERMIEEGDAVAVQFMAKGTHSGTWMEFAPTRKSIHYAGVTVARIAEDKIVEHTTCWDKAALIEQISKS